MTTDLPTKKGYYWWMAKGKDFGGAVKSVVRVFQNRHKRFYVEHKSYDRCVEDWEDDSVQYWQYIPEPETP